MLNHAIIGCGRISHKHLEGIANNSDISVLVAICDIDTRKLEKHSVNPQLKPYQDYKQLLKDPKIDIVHICTPSGTHAQIAIDALNSGKHVLVEKPMALSIKDADLMISTAKKNNKVLAVCHQNRFNPPIQLLKTCINDRDVFGNIYHGQASIRWNRGNEYYTQDKWHGTWAQDGGVLMNQSIHTIDLLQWIIGSEVVSVFGRIHRFARQMEAEDFGCAILKFKNGATGIVEGTALAYPENIGASLSIFGETGTAIIAGSATNEIKVFNTKYINTQGAFDLVSENDANSEFDKKNVYGIGHSKLIKDVAESILSNKKPSVTGEDGKKALEIVLAIYKSQKESREIRLPLLDFSTIDMDGVF